MFMVRVALVLLVVIEIVAGLGYLLNNEYYDLPAGAQLVVDAPQPSFAQMNGRANGPFERAARSKNWRNIGLGKRSDVKERSFARAMIGLGK